MSLHRQLALLGTLQDVLVASHVLLPSGPRGTGNIPSIRLSHPPALPVKEGIADTSWGLPGASQEAQQVSEAGLGHMGLCP